MGILDFPKVAAKVHLNEDVLFNGAEIHSYTTYDSISGSVILTNDSVNPVPFDHVQISLVGSTKTYKLDHMSPHSASTQTFASHVFLRLTQPIPQTAYNGDFELKQGEARKFDFEFVVPEQLLPTACDHERGGDHVHDAHLNLLPSMGEYLMPLDDLAPDMSKVTYTISTKLIQHPPGGGSKALVQAGRKVHIIPAMAEEPPIHIGPQNPEYLLCRTKKLRKSMFGGKFGTLTISTSQPRPLVLNPSAPKSRQPATIINLNLKFTPAPGTEAKPPRLGAVGVKLKATTYSSIRAVREIPDDSTRTSPYERFAGSYHNTVTLPSRTVDGTTWHWRIPSSAYARRDSGYSTISTESSHDSSYEYHDRKGSTISTSTVESVDIEEHYEPETGYYETNVPLPLSLPNTKTWLPTFHSCLISRFYTLIISAPVHSGSSSVASSTFTLRVPVQICSLPREGRREAFRQAAEEEQGLPDFADVRRAGGRRRVQRVREVDERQRLREIEQEVDAQLRRGSEGSVDSAIAIAMGDDPPGYERATRAR